MSWQEKINAALDARRAADALRRRYPVAQGAGRWLVADDRQYLNFSSNDYLGLSHHPQIIRAWQQGAEQFGIGSGGSGHVSGYSVVHQALEEELGVRLFDRMNKRVLLTVDGQRFLEYANSILDTIQSARQALNENAELDGSLHIGTLESLCFFRLPGLIRQFRLEHPRVGLRFPGGAD